MSLFLQARFALSTTRGRIVAACAVGVLLLLAVVADMLLRGPIERAALTDLLGSATGYVVSIDSVRREGGHLVLAGLHAHSRGGALVVDVDRVEIDSSGPRTLLTVDG